MAQAGWRTNQVSTVFSSEVNVRSYGSTWPGTYTRSCSVKIPQ